ncbi:hypothetical protein ACN27J_17120 [Solwaraspora sp. WMMB762]|uniref:hypothetical protein n=1 Tax=Solwaraspora sp. WMMB762 TaxID=3404120 RepID=UPI003B94F74A
MSMQVPRIFTGLVDDAAVFPPGNADLPDAITAHRGHRTAWYTDLVGPFLLPASEIDVARRLVGPGDELEIGLIGDTGVAALPAAVEALPTDRIRPRQVEVAVAKRGEDPQPGLRALLTALAGWPKISGYAEVPLTWGLLAALDSLAEARAGGVDVAAKFRTGGLAAELFPTPVELAAVICACRDRALPFKLTAGLHHAIRDTDPETGFTHHGFLNVLAATITAAEGAEVAEVAELLATTDAARLIEPARTRGGADRPLWVGFGSCSITDPLTDLVRLGLINGGFA